MKRVKHLFYLYFKRRALFCVRLCDGSCTSLLQHNLKVMMLTTIYVACKVEENYVSAEEFGKGMHEVGTNTEPTS